ncbi:MAG TPA: type VII secretion protein EccB [Actinoplanes sp.]|nr:type VII secretion protein EccB [Actinoplanes sp.]
MPTRQDQLHSYQYSLQRVVSALVTHDPEAYRSPLRRAGTTALISLVIAALAVGGAAIYGLLTGHSTVQLRDESVVFLEKGSGARYVYLRSDDRLHPVLNYASGLLIANGPAPKLVSTSRERLATVPLGDPLGIPQAPDSLPGKADLRTADWSVCSATSAGSARPQSTVLVGERPTDGTVAAAAARALLVRDPTDRTFLLSGNRRFLIPPDRETASLRALGWNAQQPWPVAAAFVNAIPLGPDLVAPEVPAFGSRSGVAGYRVGQLLTDGSQWSVALADGAAAVTEVQARLLRARPAAYPPRTLDNSFNTLPPSRIRLSAADGMPATVPELITPAERVCMTLPVDRLHAELRIDPTVPPGVAVRGAATMPGGVQADLVYVARGKGALAVAAASPDAPAGTGTVSIVTDTGLRYPIAGRELLGRLGYGGVSPRQVPAQLVALLPQGPALDADEARRSAATA